jgi:hypothetical protein
VRLTSVAHHPRLLIIAPRALWNCAKYRILLKWRSTSALIEHQHKVRHPARRPTIAEIAHAVSFAAECIPGSHCLAQGLAFRELMHHYGYPCELRLGVATQGGFRAHAWVTSCDRVVYGYADGFVPLQRSDADFRATVETANRIS